MNSVLLIAYFFPPKGGAGTQRFGKFCKYLPESGWQPQVVAAGDDQRDRSAPHDDPTLAAELAHVPVRRIGPARGTPLQRLRRRLRLCLDEDEWASAALAAARDWARAERPDCVLTTLSPFAAYRIGHALRRELDLPWVLDLRDPWALDGWRSHRTPLHAAYDLHHMRRALRAADQIVANVPAAAREYVRLGADPARVVVIPNGWDEDDFAADTADAGEGAAPVPAAERADAGTFRVVHHGTLHDADAAPGLTRNGRPRWRHRQIAPLGRTGFYLLQALAALDRTAPELARRVTLHFYGNVDASHRTLAARLGVADRVREHGYVAHERTIDSLRAADAVFVPLHGVPPGERALVVPGKLYESLASGRPVLAALPDGDGADLVRALDAGVVAGPTSIEEVAQALDGLVRRWAAGDPARGCDRARLRPFTRRALSARLAAVLAAAAQGRCLQAPGSPWLEVDPAGPVSRAGLAAAP